MGLCPAHGRTSAPRLLTPWGLWCAANQVRVAKASESLRWPGISQCPLSMMGRTLQLPAEP